jgi:hypothetical protein
MAGNDDHLDLNKDLADLRQGPTLSEQEAAMRKGRMPMLVGMVGVVVIILVGSFVLLREDDEKLAYSEIGKTINGIKQEFFDGFWGCALKGVNLRDIKSNDALIAQINRRGAKAASVYARLLRQNCTDKLEEMQTKLEVLIAPEGVTKEVKEMTEATSKLRSAWSGFISYMDDPKTKYDEATARPKIIEITRGWYEYKKAHTSFNKAVKAKIE